MQSIRDIVFLILMGAAIAVVFSGCRKTDETLPQIVVESPGALQQFIVPVDLPIIAEFSDDMALETITVELRTSNLQPTGVAMSLAVSGNFFQLDTILPLNDVKLASGRYFLRYTAFDGTNLRSTYQEIHVTGVARAFVDVYGVTSGPGSSLVQWNNNVQQSMVTHTGQVEAAAIDSWHQRYFVNLNTPGELHVFDLQDNAQDWSFAVPGLPPAAATGKGFFRADERRYFMLKQASSVVTAGSGGVEKTVEIAFSVNHTVQSFSLNNAHIVSLQKEFSGSNKRLVSSFRSSGAFVNSIPLLAEPVDVCFTGGDEFLVLLNNGGSGELHLYDASANNLVFIQNIPLGVALVESNGEILVLTYSGSYRYQNGGVQLISSSLAVHVAYEELSNTFFLAEGNQINRYDAVGILLETRTASAPLEAVLLLYNK